MTIFDFEQQLTLIDIVNTTILYHQYKEIEMTV